MGGPERAPKPPTLRAPAEPWRSANVQSNTAPSGPPKPPALRAPAEPWRSANVQSNTTSKRARQAPRHRRVASGPRGPRRPYI
jgi:hypothetical protein